MTPEEFQQKLQNIVSTAEKQNLIIEKEDVEKAFAGDRLNETQLQLVYEFLQTKKILVRGFRREKENSVPPVSGQDDSAEPVQGKENQDRFGSEQERHNLDLYMDEIAAVRPLGEGEEALLLEKLRARDPEAKRRITELMLADIVKLARQIKSPDVSLQDLIQEANLQVVLGADRLDYRMTGSLQDVRDRLLEDARQAMDTLLEEQREVHTRDRRMVERVEELKDTVNTLKKKLGRKVYLDEVADEMEISEEEASDILRLAGEEAGEDDGSSPEGSSEGKEN